MARSARSCPPPAGDANGLHAYVTGEAGFEADRSEAVKGIDETLLLVTCGVLVLLLLAIYRSPLVAFVPLFVVASPTSSPVGYLRARARGHHGVSGQTTAILIVLMFGVGTDYCLLIVARFRDELRRTDDVGEAMARATERTGPAILSAGAIVIVAMLVLALADFNATREMGPILALGVAVMVVAGLTLLPALLATLGRRAFWPAVRGRGRAPCQQGLAERRPAGRLARPAAIAIAVTRDPASWVRSARSAAASRSTSPRPSASRPNPSLGEQLISDRFIPGRAAPLNVVTAVGATEGVYAALTTGRPRLCRRCT